MKKAILASILLLPYLALVAHADNFDQELAAIQKIGGLQPAYYLQGKTDKSISCEIDIIVNMANPAAPLTIEYMANDQNNDLMLNFGSNSDVLSPNANGLNLSNSYKVAAFSGPGEMPLPAHVVTNTFDIESSGGKITSVSMSTKLGLLFLGDQSVNCSSLQYIPMRVCKLSGNSANGTPMVAFGTDSTLNNSTNATTTDSAISQCLEMYNNDPGCQTATVTCSQN